MPATSGTWLQVSPASDFSLANIPFGIVSRKTSARRVPAIRIGDYILELAAFSDLGGFDPLPAIRTHLSVFHEPTLNAFAGLGRKIHSEVRSFIQNILSQDTAYADVLRDNDELKTKCLLPVEDAQNHLPMSIGDFSDFYGGINHAVNAGALFRGQKGALLPNYLHLPTAYHGRSSSIFVSGTPVKRPWGQCVRDMDTTPKVPEFDVCRTMDFELELGAFVCKENLPGERIPVDDASSHLFGFVLLNDWSARDIQRWEYVPLGPFNGKNFATNISPWIVLADALEPHRAKSVQNTETLLPYLNETRSDSVYDLNLEVILTSGKTGKSTTICQNKAPAGLIWSFQQMLAHHTVSGCPMRVGDLLGSGTISGLTKDSLGCLLEQTLNGKEPIELVDGERRTWLEDGDAVTLRGYAADEVSGRVGFGDCCGQLLPADKLEKTH